MIPAQGQIREQDHPLKEEGLDPQVEQAIVQRGLTTWQYFRRFWDPALRKGDKCWKDLIGDIFSAGEEEEYRRQDKLKVSIPELVPKINALEGMQIGARRTGTILAVGGEDAPDTELIGHVVREDVQRKNHIDMQVTASFTDGIVTGFPQAMWFDKASPDDRDKKLDVYHGQWNDSLPDPKFTRADYSDAEETQRYRTMSRQKLLLTYPLRKKQIEARIPENSGFDTLSVFPSSSATDSSSRDQIIQTLQSETTGFAQAGLIYVIERDFFVTMDTEVWVAPGTDRVETLPPEWSQAEINRWKEFHPNYRSIKKGVRILWVTAFTSFGLLLENRPHWFQESEMPCEWYIPRIWNNKFYGIVEFMSGSLKGRNVTKIEHLHSLRFSNDGLMLVKKGALANPASAATEKGRVGGIIVLNAMASMDDVSFPVNQRENLGWKDMSELFYDDLNRLSVDRNFEGGSQSSQESGKVVKLRNASTQAKHLPQLTMLGLYNLRVTRKILLMIPYLWTEEELFRYVDPKTQEQKQAVLNEAVDWDWYSGAVTRVKNNLDGARYDYVEAEGDNSPTAQEAEMAAFQDLLDHLGQIQDVTLWPALLSSVPNRMAQSFSRALEKKFEDQANAAKDTPPAPGKLSASIDLAKLGSNPLAIDVLRKAGLLDAAPAGTPPAAAAQPQQPSASPQPEAAS